MGFSISIAVTKRYFISCLEEQIYLEDDYLGGNLMELNSLVLGLRMDDLK